MSAAFSLEPFPRYQPCDFLFRVPGTPAELAAFWKLRTRIFCQEQGLFDGSDRDEIDARMIPIVCVSLVMDMPDRVVGVVRIDEREPGDWWGGRLGVEPELRHLDGISPGVAQRNRQPRGWPTRSVGAGLVFKAVSLARARGCRRFRAHVQAQNVAFFRRLQWRALERVQVCGLPHVTMQADLRHYPPDALLEAS